MNDSPSNPIHPGDQDPEETQEWLDSLQSVVETTGKQRARFLLTQLIERASRDGVMPPGPVITDYINTIPVEEEVEYPGDHVLEKRIRRIIRWNAVAMVNRANHKYEGLGGHLSTYASSASLYEVGFNHFFRGKDGEGSGDQIFYQGHAAPGMYARSFLEGRIPIETLEYFRREAEHGKGLPSYPHARLLPRYWEFPTVSMGIGPMTAVYQARFNRYLHNRGIADTSQSRVWAFLGDGETDEPEALGALTIAAREGLDNLVFVVNCNLQRLDGPVRGNGKIIQELEGVFRGAGWNCLKVIWGPEWDELLQKDTEGLLRRRMNEVVDGQWQRYTTAPGGYTRKDFFGTDPRLLDIVSHLSDDQVRKLRRGGHSFHKIYSAYDRAVNGANGRPTAILAHTVKGWTLGDHFEGVNVTHQKKKMTVEELRSFRDTLHLPVADDKLEDAPFYHPGKNSPEVQYMLERREALGGCIPKRRDRVQVRLDLPGDKLYAEFRAGMKKGEASTTMVFARLLAQLLRDPNVGRRVVPIIPDEARTFGMDALFSQVGIYSAVGQLYEPVDKGKLLYYRESKSGQVLEEGITEAGAVASFTVAATSYSTHGQPMIPFYIFYSMFGFQRTADQLWALGDAMGRGFLLGATAGRTTLQGEGLQHNDGHSHVFASTVPCCRAYDVAYAYELSTVIEDGLQRMFVDDEHIFYYITLQNENYPMPPAPDGVREGVIRGMYRLNEGAPITAATGAKKKPGTKTAKTAGKNKHVQLFGSGTILLEVLKAQEILTKYGVSADVWSVTSYTELRRDALRCDRLNRLHPEAEREIPYIEEVLDGVEGPFVAATDYMKMVPDQISQWLPGRLTSLGTDGFGISDVREGLRLHFEVNAAHVAAGALYALQREGVIEGAEVAAAIRELGIDTERIDPLSV